MAWFNKIRLYLMEKISITIIPSPDHKIRTLAFRRIVPVLLIIFILLTTGILAGLYKYYQHSYLQLAARQQKIDGMRAENQLLKSQLYALNLDTEELKKKMDSLKRDNDNIRKLLKLEQKNKTNVNYDRESFPLETRPVKNSYSRGLPVGGNGLLEPKKILIKTRDNIDKLKQQIPEQQIKLANYEKQIRSKNMLSMPDIWPMADRGDSFISSEFGWRNHPITRKREFHEGLDIGVWYNTPVLAGADGKVTFVGWNGGYGRLIKIDHGNGYETRYGHLGGYKVKRGEKVKKGQVIGLSGNSGRSTGPHLHYEVRKNGIPHNPRNYIGR